MKPYSISAKIKAAVSEQDTNSTKDENIFCEVIISLFNSKCHLLAYNI